MKANRYVAGYLAALLVASAAAFALPAHAHRMGHGAEGMPGAHGGAGSMRLLRGLDLTQEQRDQIFTIHHEQAPAARERAKAARAAHDALRQAAADPNADSARIRQLADALGSAQADAAVARVETMRRVLAVLTPEQRTKLEEARERRLERRGGGGRH